jgi:hypothetical protein
VARIRTIKPELWQDEKLSVLDPVTRLVFIGLISMADDAGRLVDNVKSIDGFIFPETEDTCKDSLGILARLSRILRYVAPSGQRVIQIANWQRHQRVDHPNQHVLPGPPTEVVEAAQDAPVSLGTRENGARESRNPLATTSTSTNDQRPVPTTVEVGSLALVPSRSPGPARTLEAVEARLAVVLAGVSADAHRRAGADEIRRAGAALVFSYWARKLDHPKALLDDDRERRLVKRLTENGGDVHELLYVVDGALKDDWTMGRSQRSSKKFDGIETIFQDRAHVEKFAALCPGYKAGTPHPMATKFQSTEVA